MIQTDLKRKTINGFFWGLLESIFSQGQGILFGIILARILSIEEFGLLGMITIFISISQVFVDSGLNQALIRKQNCTENDYSTVFWVNFLIGILLYLVLWFTAPVVSSFYNEPNLEDIIRVAALVIIISSVSLVQQTKIIKEIDFKTITFISSIGTFIAGVVAIYLAYTGFGVWSLVWRTIINQVARSGMLWVYNRWYPKNIFSFDSFKELFGFGSNILFISLIATLFKNLYNLIIGKSYSKIILGYYTNAEQYSAMASNTISSVTSRVSYPILSKLQNDNIMLKKSCSKLVHTIMFSSFFIMFGIAAVADPLITVLLGEKWLPAAIYLQSLSIAYSITPMHMINQNILKVKGRSDLFFRTEIIKYILIMPIITIGIFMGLHVLIIGIVVFYWISFLINAMYSGKLINYSALQQMKEIAPLILICAIPAFIAYGFGVIYPLSKFILLIVEFIIYISVVFGISIIIKLPAFFDIKEIIIQKLGFFNFLKK